MYASSLVWTRSREGKERLNTSCEAGSKSGGGALPAARRIRFSSYLGYMSSIPGARRAAFPENKSREEKKTFKCRGQARVGVPRGKADYFASNSSLVPVFFRYCCCYYVTGSLGCLCDTPRRNAFPLSLDIPQFFVVI